MTRRRGPEDEVAQVVDTILTLAGFHLTKMPQGTRPGIPRPTKGTPDRYIKHRRRPVAAWIELKKKGGTLSSEQEEFLDLHRMHVDAFSVPFALVWDDWTKCLAWLENMRLARVVPEKPRGEVAWTSPDGITYAFPHAPTA